jgi:protein involved in polysaccharide export with SLBB domain
MKKNIVLILSAVSFFVFSSPFSASAGEKSVAVEGDSEYYRIAAGDRIDITVYDEEDLSGQFEVKEDGSISYPLVGSVKVLSMTRSQLESRLAELLRDGYLVNPYVRVSIPKFGTRNILIIGHVAKPGAYTLPEDGNPTILKAIVDVGGFTQMANPSGTRIVRTTADGKKFTINPHVNEIMSGRRQDINLEPGDLIVVPERLF